MTPAEAVATIVRGGGRLVLAPGGETAEILLPDPTSPAIESAVDEARRHRAEVLTLLRSRENVVVLPPDRPRRAVPADASVCPACGGTDFWISLALVWVCERCHPPASEKIVARREKCLATLPQVARTPEGPARSIPPAVRPGGAA